MAAFAATPSALASADDMPVANPETAVDMQIPGLILDLGGIPFQLFTATPRIGSLPESLSVAQGYGVTWTWFNLQLGTSGIVPANDGYRTDVYTGPGQIVVTANMANQVTPAVGTFYLPPEG